MAELILIVENVNIAVDHYTKLFKQTKIIEITSYELGLNEAVINVAGMQLHLMEENPEHGLHTYKGTEPLPFTINVTVDDIELINKVAIELGLEFIMKLTHMEKFGVSNLIFIDNFGYSWMIHQVHEAKSFEERTQAIEEDMGIKPIK